MLYTIFGWEIRDEAILVGSLAARRAAGRLRAIVVEKQLGTVFFTAQGSRTGEPYRCPNNAPEEDEGCSPVLHLAKRRWGRRGRAAASFGNVAACRRAAAARTHCRGRVARRGRIGSAAAARQSREASPNSRLRCGPASRNRWLSDQQVPLNGNLPAAVRQQPQTVARSDSSSPPSGAALLCSPYLTFCPPSHGAPGKRELELPQRGLSNWGVTTSMGK